MGKGSLSPHHRRNGHSMLDEDEELICTGLVWSQSKGPLKGSLSPPWNGHSTLDEDEEGERRFALKRSKLMGI